MEDQEKQEAKFAVQVLREIFELAGLEPVRFDTDYQRHASNANELVVIVKQWKNNFLRWRQLRGLVKDLL